MKVRGSLNITKNLKVDNTAGTFPFQGGYVRSEADGLFYFGDIVINVVEDKIYKEEGSLVIDNGVAYISIIPNANGSLPLNLNSWQEFGSGGNCDCISTIQIGPYPPGTPLEQIILELHFPDNLSNLDVAGYGTTITENVPITDPTIDWHMDGAPTNMRLSDNKGLVSNVDVTGLTSYTPSGITYNYPGGSSVTWTLTSNETTPITTTITWVAIPVYSKTYFGTTGATTGTPDEATILAGDFVEINTNPSFNVFEGVQITGENFFIAVPMSQTHGFTKFRVDATAPYAAIGADGDFTTLEDKGTVQVNGADYHVYATAYARHKAKNQNRVTKDLLKRFNRNTIFSSIY